MITLDPASATPPFEQVRASLAAAVNSGELVVGDRLPTVRRLASDLGLAVNTVARAYRELESEGVIETRGRAGSFVAGDASEAELRRAAAAYAERVRALGVGAEEAVAAFRHVLSAK